MTAEARQGPAGARLQAALAAFDDGRPLQTADLLGRWRGEEVPTGHPVDGLLRTYRWWGKAFRGPDDVDPLLFAGARGRVRALDPRRLPVGVAVRGWAPRSAVLGRLAVVAHPVLATARPRARLRRVEVRGVVSAAMLYDHLPVLDAFREDADGSVLGLMERRGDTTPFVFRLRREA